MGLRNYITALFLLPGIFFAAKVCSNGIDDVFCTIEQTGAQYTIQGTLCGTDKQYAGRNLDFLPVMEIMPADKMEHLILRLIGEAFNKQSFDPDFVTDWPYEVARRNKNFTNDSLVLYVKTRAPVKAIAESVTQEGILGIRIENEKGDICFEKSNMLTGNYVVDLNLAGSYVITIYAKHHTGNFRICAVEKGR